jgi:hypothetical protein
VSEIRTHEQVVGIIGILAQEANDDGVNEREELGPQTKQAIEWLSATDAALRATLDREIEARHAAEEATANHREHALRTIAAEADLARLRAAATVALAVLTRLADSAVYWSSYDVPVGLVSEVDEAKARLAGVLHD